MEGRGGTPDDTPGPAEFFEQRGFRLSFSRPSEEDLEALYTGSGVTIREYRRLRRQEKIGPVIATLHAITNPDFVLVAYGTGATEEAAAARARERWLTEEGD